MINQLSKNEDNPLLLALAAITSWLKEQNISYMVFGGIANSVYGNPRQTFDIDIKIALDSAKPIETFIEKLGIIAEIIPQQPIQFIQDTNVLPVEVANVRIDLVFASLPFEIEAIRRSKSIMYFDIDLKVCTIEDLIIHKAISTRQKDWIDIEILIHDQRQIIDWPYLLKNCTELSDFLDRSEIIKNIRRLKDEI
jgi:hypothetical protein